MYADMPQPSQWIFNLFTLPIFKTLLIDRTLVFKVATTGTKGCTLESCIVYFCNIEDSHISQGQEKIWYGGPQWTVHSSVQFYLSQFAGLGNHLPCSSTDPRT